MKKYWLLFVLQMKTFWNFLFTPNPRWMDIRGYENIYQISEYGDIYNMREFKNVSTFIKKDGYECVALTNGRGEVKQHRVHRLVATAFLPNKEHKNIVKHKNGDKTNNSVSNLMWV